MNIKKIIDVLVVISSIFFTQQIHAGGNAPPKRKPVRTVQPKNFTKPINIYVNNTNNNHKVGQNKATIQDMTNKVQLSIDTKIFMHMQQKFNYWQQQIVCAARIAREQAIGLVNEAKQFLYKNKYKLLAGGIACTYAYLFFQTSRAQKYMTKKGLWSTWKVDTNLENLLAVPQKGLALELITEIQRRYVNTDNPADFIFPFTRFIEESGKEMKQLRSYLNIHEWVKNFRLEKLFPFRVEILVIQQRIQRLVFLKNLFSSWIAQYRLDINMTEPQSDFLN